MTPTRLDAAITVDQLPAGDFVAHSGTRAYITLRFLANTAQATVLEERTLPGGRLELTVRYPSAVKRNPAGDEYEAEGVIEVTPKWLRDNVMRDYVNWREAWWREAVQNSVDAGATLIKLSAEEETDEAGNQSWLIVCEDNGSGMTQEVMEDPENGFLVMGGSTKAGGRGAGAFGKAKEMLIMPWLEWKLTTLGKQYSGVGRKWKRKSAPHHQGVKLEVRMPADLYTDKTVAMAFLEKCYLPGITFRVNGHTVSSTKMPTPATLLYQDQYGGIYQGPRSRTPLLYVRKNGLWMFSHQLPSHSKVDLVCEVTAPSKLVFTQSRDEFQWNVSLKSKIEEFQYEVATEGKIKKGLGEYREEFKGSGLFSLPHRTAAILNEAGPLPEIKRGSVAVHKNTIESIVHSLASLAAYESDMNPEDKFGMVEPDAARAILDAVEVKGQAQYESMVKQLVWKPSFLILKDKNLNYNVPKRFKPAFMTPSILRLARVWAELCRVALIGLGSSEDYGVGWHFTEEAQALYSSDNGHWLMLYPFKGGLEQEEMWDPGKREDLAMLWSLAIHECTHMHDGVMKHTDSYAAALTQNVGKLAESWSIAKRAAAAVKLRGQVPKKEKPAPRREAPEAKVFYPELDAVVKIPAIIQHVLANQDPTRVDLKNLAHVLSYLFTDDHQAGNPDRSLKNFGQAAVWVYDDLRRTTDRMHRWLTPSVKLQLVDEGTWKQFRLILKDDADDAALEVKRRWRLMENEAGDALSEHRIYLYNSTEEA